MSHAHFLPMPSYSITFNPRTGRFSRTFQLRTCRTTTTTASTSVDSGALLISEPYFDASAHWRTGYLSIYCCRASRFCGPPRSFRPRPSSTRQTRCLICRSFRDMTVSPPATVDPSVSESAPSMLAAVDPSSNKPDEMVAPAADVFSSPALSDRCVYSDMAVDYINGCPACRSVAHVLRCCCYFSHSPVRR